MTVENLANDTVRLLVEKVKRVCKDVECFLTCVLGDNDEQEKNQEKLWAAGI